MTKDVYDPGIIAKLERAYGLVRELQAVQRELREQPTDAEYERVDNAGAATDPLIWIEWRLKRAPDPLPLAFSALLGDVIQNARAALDYCAWAAVDDRIRQQTPRQVAFPLMDDEEKFIEWRTAKASWYAEPTMKTIELAQPFRASADHMHPLRVLRELSNIDKHRLLHVVAYSHFDIAPVGIEPEPVVKRSTGHTGAVNVGDVLVRVEFPRLESRRVELRPTFAWYESVTYEEANGQTRALRIDDMIEAIWKMVMDTTIQMHIARRIESGELNEDEDGSPGSPSSPFPTGGGRGLSVELDQGCAATEPQPADVVRPSDAPATP